MKNYLISYSTNVAGVLLCLAVFSLTLRFGWPWPALKFFELFTVLFFAVLILVVLASVQARSLIRNLWLHLRAAFAWLALLASSFILGLFYSAIFLPEWRIYASEVVLEYFRFVFVVAFFLGATFFLYLCPVWRKRVLATIMISPLVLWLSRIPIWSGLFFGIEDQRLRGPGNDPNYLGGWIALGLILSSAYFLYSRDRKRWLGLPLVATLIPLLLWTASRGAILSAAVASLFLIVFYFRNSFLVHRKFLDSIWVTGFLILGVLLSWTSASPEIRGAMIDRIVRPFTDSTSSVGMPSNESLDYLASGRDTLFLTGFKKFISHPLGFGLSYHYWQPIMLASDGHKLGPHNLFLQVGLSGGYLGLVALLGFLVNILRYAKNIRIKDDWESNGLVVCLIALLVNSLFLDTLTLRWLWLVISLIVSGLLLRRFDLGKDFRK